MAIVRDPLASVESGLVEIDTTRRSLIHRMSLGGTGESEPSVKSIAKTYVAAALLTYGAMAVVAALEWMLGPARPDVKLPFWQDATTAFMFLVAFPTILVLVVTDNAALRAAMRRVQRDGVLTMTAAQEAIIEQRWSATFARLNAVIQIVALATGAAIMIANYFAYRPETVGFWVASGGRLRPAGYVFLLSVWAFFAVIPIYVARTFAISFLLANVVRAGDIRMLPFHPDKCGGLRPVGSLALRNQYGLSVMGINVVLFALMSMLYLDTPQSLSVLIALAVVAYLVVGPIVFMGPLLPFRAGMMRTKSELMSEVAQRLRIELSRIRAELQSGVITREDEELIDRLRKIGAVIDELPVWPFDAGILRRFLTAYVVPLIGAMVYPFASIVFDKVVSRLR